MTPTRAVDVRQLPTYAFGHRSTMWWGTVCLMAIEGTVFAMTIASYFYLRERVPQWPASASPPTLLWGSINTAIMLVSLIPNELTKKAAEKEQLGPVRLWLGVGLALALAFIAVRWFEFKALNVRWDVNAYGSVTWTLLGLHTTHLVTDFIDSAVLEVLMFVGPVTGKRFADVSENSVYWYFVVVSWLPIYLVLYFAPRVL